MSTKIEWTDETWNVVTGCTPISPGCANCYARRMARRLAGRFGYPEAPDHFNVTLRPDRLKQPLHWCEPRMVFVCSMSDLFHEDVPPDFTWKVIEVMWMSFHHTFQILTKRPERAADILTRSMWWNNDTPRNIWLGVTAENQEQADKRIPILLQIPAAVRFVSVEPMLEPIDLTLYTFDSFQDEPLDWVIVGAETGPGKREMQLDWARDILHTCKSSGTPFFFKKDGVGNHTLDGVMYEEFPR